MFRIPLHVVLVICTSCAVLAEGKVKMVLSHGITFTMHTQTHRLFCPTVMGNSIDFKLSSCLLDIGKCSPQWTLHPLYLYIGALYGWFISSFFEYVKVVY